MGVQYTQWVTLTEKCPLVVVAEVLELTNTIWDCATLWFIKSRVNLPMNAQ